MKLLSCAIAALTVSLMAGCGNKTAATTTTTPTPTGPTTSVFASRLTVKGSAARTFTVSQAGTVTVALTSLSTPSTVVGLGIGVPNGGIARCTLSLSLNTTASASPQIAAQVDPGSYCVAIYDPGTLTSSVDFDITIVYP